MLNQIRPVFSAILIVAFFVSTFIFSHQTTKACPPRIPATLLTLYMNSDLIILAELENERIIKKHNENENGFYADLARDLAITKIYKGNNKQLKKISYNTSEYKSNMSDSAEPQMFFIGYGGSVPVKVGEQYLFFLSGSDDGKYYVTDNLGGIKNADETLGIYEEKLRELNTINENKENQLENITEWLVTAIDEPVTRWGAIQDLYNSSNSLSYENSNPKDNKTLPFAFGKNFNTYSSAIAKSLTDAQKAKISNLLMDEIQTSWFGQETTRIDYRLPQIAKNWDKTRFANYAFSVLQSIDDSNFKKKLRVMEFISGMAEDDKLFDIHYDYARLRTNNKPQNNTKGLSLRQEKMQEFNNRYQILLAQNFKPDTKK